MYKENDESNVCGETDPLQNKYRNQTHRNSNFKRIIYNIITNTTVEPSMFVYIMVHMILTLTIQNLSLEKACRVNLNYSIETCTSMKLQQLNNQSHIEAQAQKIIAALSAQKTCVTMIVPTILALFIGSYSDKTGQRKIFLIMVLAGQLLMCINNILNVVFFDQLNLEVLVFSNAVLEGMSGGLSIFFLAAFSYIGVITTTNNRTYRLGLMDFALNTGFPIGNAISGMLLRYGSYYICYGTAAFLSIINILYNVCVISDPQKSVEQKKYQNIGICNHLRMLFDIKHIMHTIKFLFKKSSDNRRVRLITLLIMLGVYFGIVNGENSILYLSTRYRLNWDVVMFSMFQTLRSSIHMIGTIFTILVISKYLQWHDSVVGIISCTSKIFGNLVYSFATSGNIFFIAPAMEALSGPILLITRSLLSKTVTTHELGKVNSLAGLCENMTPLLYVYMYAKVYTETMEVLPGTVFLLGVAMVVPTMFVFIWLYVSHRRVKAVMLEEESLNATKMEIP